MARSFDVSVENLRNFNELLGVTNPVVETDATDLANWSQLLTESQSNLSDNVRELEQEVNLLETEAQTSEKAAVSECQELAQSAGKASDTDLPSVESEAAAARQSATKAVDEQTTAVQAAFGELQSAGWEPLNAGVASQRSDFERWVGEAEAALGQIESVADQTSTALEAGAHEAAVELSHWYGSPAVDPQLWKLADEGLDKVQAAVVPSFRGNRQTLGEEFAKAYEDMTVGMGAQAQEMRTQTEAAATTLGGSIEQVATITEQVVTEAVGELDDTKVEFDTSVIRAADAEPKAGALEDLARRIEVADAQLDQVRETLEGMGT